MGDHKHEHSDVSLRSVLIFGASLIIAAVLIHWIVERFYADLGHRYPPTVYGSRQGPPTIQALSPQLQSNPAADLAAMRRRDRQILESYGWIDQRAGVIRIPIERAMQLSAQRAAARKATSDSQATKGSIGP